MTTDDRLGMDPAADYVLPLSKRAKFTPIPSVATLLGNDYTPELKAAFPDVMPSFRPTGYLALFQLRMPPRKLGSIYLADESKDEEFWRTQAALVRALGPSCFRDRQTGAPWVEGPWFEPGDFVRIPMYGSDRFDMELKNADGTIDKVRFALIKEADITALLAGDPLNVKNS